MTHLVIPLDEDDAAAADHRWRRTSDTWSVRWWPRLVGHLYEIPRGSARYETSPSETQADVSNVIRATPQTALSFPRVEW